MSGVTMAGEMAGTLAYMPPEQLRNFRDVKPQSDIYAVGMTAYSLLSGSLALNLNSKSNVNDTIRAILTDIQARIDAGGGGLLIRAQTDTAIIKAFHEAQVQLDSLIAETKRNPSRFWF